MIRKTPRLLPRQIRFAEYCLTEPSAARAAVRAGYAPESARNQAYRLLKNDDIRRRITGGLADLSAQDRARRERLLENCETIFQRALALGRLEPALGALVAETQLAGLLARTRHPSPAQRVMDDEAATAPEGIEPEEAGKL